MCNAHAFAFELHLHLQVVSLQLHLHLFWFCTCIQVCLQLHCNFICMCTRICFCICVDACIAFALQLSCICICACISQVAKASCNGLRNDACQHVGSYCNAGLQIKAREQLLAPLLNHVRKLQEVATSGKSIRFVDITVCVFVGRFRPPLTRLGNASHRQPFLLGSRWYSFSGSIVDSLIF